MKNLVFIIFITLTNYCFAQKNKIKVNVIGIAKIEGSIFMAILNDQEKELENRIITITNTNCSFEINYTLGQKIAVKVFQDLNNDQKLNTNSIGFPKEPWGVSNNVKPFLGPPNFQKMLFTVNKNTKNITIKLQ